VSGVVRYRTESGAALGWLSGPATVLPLREQTWAELFSAGRPTPAVGGQPIEDAVLLSPVERPGKILCAGINYGSHKNENPAAVLPQVPFFFSKLPSAVVGPGEPILKPQPDTQLDYEVELAVVIGRRAKALSPDAALDAVWGYTVMNDISARNIQFVDSQITLGKGGDGFCPLGPCVVPAAEVPDPQDLIVSSYVNGDQRQKESTANMLFSVAELLAYVSRYITLDVGDVVTTGTPAGVGCFMQPQSWLQPGDLVQVQVDGIGRLSNPVEAGW
jgi:2-keto-4-pentenoate hydratase/2-oxohepta-3-ene-1,7-dioic acid hydratase in catechol pathway